MDTLDLNIDPHWGCSDKTNYDFTLQDRKDLQALDIRDMYLAGYLTIGEFTELMKPTGVPYFMDDMTGLVKLIMDDSLCMTLDEFKGYA